MSILSLGVAESCAHVLVESSRDADGSIWARCELCGDDGFPIRDVQYERWREVEEAAAAQAQAEYDALPIEEKLRQEVRVQSSVREFWQRRAEKLQAQLTALRAERDLLEAAVRKAVTP